jgi:molecular chaperone DnaK (HSP70)
MGKIFGIDLGTTYSCIAYVDEYGKPVTVPNSENSPVTPSVVFFESPDSISVGEVAKQALQSDPSLVCSTIKREMGHADYNFEANGKKYRPEEVSALILKKLAQDASEKLNEEVKDVIITCPAYFGLEEREATKKAGEIAGLNVLSIINEPTAAAISYGLKVDEPQTVIVYDLGGGTFDVTVIKVSEGEIDVIATGGDHHLGGKDWDARIQKYAIDQYVQASGGSEDDIYDDADAMGDLEMKSEVAKKQLSTRTSAKFNVLGQKIEITRDQFNDFTSDLLMTTISLMRDTMSEAAKKGITRYDKILLVGGSTFMPQVQDLLKSEFAGTPIEYCDPNESVARGAALYGANLQAYYNAIHELVQQGVIDEKDATDQKKVEEALHETGSKFTLPGGTVIEKPKTIRNVISKSIAAQFQDYETGQLYIQNLIFKNTTVPFDCCINCYTVQANQTEVRLNIYENNYSEGQTQNDHVPESDATLLTSGYLRPLPPNLPDRSPLELKLKINNEGLLSVDITDISRPNGVTQHIEVELKNAMSQEEVEEAARQLSGRTIS